MSDASPRLRPHLGDPCVFCGTPHDDVAIGPCPATRDQLRTQRDVALGDADYLRRKFAHMHVAGTTVGQDIDKCAKCGIDLRNAIHSAVYRGGR